jgi:hypothetical protein
MEVVMENKAPDTCSEEVDLFGQEVSVEVLETYMSDNFDGEAQASCVALLAATVR